MTLRPAPTVVVLIDAFRHDFLSEEVTPNLASLAAEGVRRDLEPILGYSDAIRATFFTGRYPDETGYWMEYCYRPEQGPWTAMARLRALDRLPSELALRGARLAISTVATRARARSRGLEHLSVRNIPFRALDRFDFTLHEPMTAPYALGCPSVFDACAESGRPWAYLDASRVHRSEDLVAAASDVPTDTGLVFVYLHQIDMAAHLLGIESPRFWSRVRSTDALFGRVLAALHARLGPFDPVVFSDHGMSILHRQASLQDLVRHRGFPERFFVALDATMVRLWYLDDDERLKAELRERIATRLPGRFLSAGDRRRYHLEFPGRLYGDEIYLLSPGYGIFPNFHSYIRPRAMHAYEPCDPDQWGIYLGPTRTASCLSERVDLTEVTRVVRHELGADLLAAP